VRSNKIKEIIQRETKKKKKRVRLYLYGGQDITQRKRKEEHVEVIYKINCLDCEVSYVGQTRRKLNTRIKEYNKAENDKHNKVEICRVSTPVK